MKLGILLSRFPYPLEKGDKLRAYYQIKELSKRHEVFLCTLSDRNISEDWLKKLEPYCSEIEIIRLSKLEMLFNLAYSLIFSKLPLQVAYFYNRRMKKSVVGFFKKNNIEHLFCQLIRVSEYVKDYNIPKTIDYMDALSQGMERRIAKAPFYLKPFITIEATRLKRYEHFIFKSFDHHAIISEQDKNLIIHAKNDSITIIANGVDQEFYTSQDSPKEFELLFTGNMSYPPNVDGVEFLANHILPLVWKTNPEIRLVIAGANPNSRVLKLANNRILVTGWVDDIRQYYSKAKIFIAPMQIGTGLQNKLLEAMAMGIPCITSTLANNALNAVHGENIMIGKNPEDYTKLILELLSNRSLAENIAKAGNKFVSKNYSWEQSTLKLDVLFLQKE
jgi:sugar transferase (PEP-CTERM/EpsH1 system associated)